ncbi:PEGA domain-containing protein [Candidatus Neomarinimicrobiota bacterium]
MKKIILVFVFINTVLLSQENDYLTASFKLNTDKFYCKLQSEPLQYVDSNKVEFLLKEGTYNFIFEKNGYRFHYENINLTENITKNIKLYSDPNSIVPYQARGILNINLNPQNAQLYINNQKVLNNKNYLLAIGSYRYLIKQRYYNSEEGRFEIIKNDTTIIKANLTPIVSTLEINTIPSESIRLYIDRQYAGRTPYINNGILIGQYNINLRDENYLPENLMIEVNESDSNKIDVKLTSYLEYQQGQRYYWKKQKRFWGVLAIYFGTVSYFVNQSAESTYTYNYMHSFTEKEIEDSRQKVTLLDGITSVALAASLSSAASFLRSFFQEIKYSK